jgi:hypothetical protein
MHVRELVELGALVAVHGSKFVQHSQLLNQRHMQHYWLASRTRQGRWFQSIKSYEQAATIRKLQLWTDVQGVVEEVLSSELLTRTWAAIGCCYDQRHRSREFEPIVRSVLHGHAESRNRVLHLLLSGEGFAVEEGVRLNRLRSQTERWTDMMLGYLACNFNVDEFAFSTERLHDFATDLRDEIHSTCASPAWELTLASLRTNFCCNLSPTSPNTDSNQRIAASILACLNTDLNGPCWSLQGHWKLRLNQIAEDAQALIDDLIDIEYAMDGN